MVGNMKEYKGFSSGISRAVLGKATFHRKNIFNRNKFVLFAENIKRTDFGYTALIKSNCNSIESFRIKTPIITLSDSKILNEINEDDIIKIEPDGNITIVWESNSQHNSLLLTERCNCKCLTCPQPPKAHENNFFDLNMRILKLAEPEKTKQIGITGGEPTLSKNQLIQIIKHCRDNYPDTTISLLSNGKNFSSFKFTKQIAEINHPRLVFCISLCSDTDTEHDRLVGAKGSFYETIAGLHNLALFKQKIELRTVIHKLNYKRLPQLSEFYYRNFPFAIHVALMGMEVTGLCLENIDELWIDPFEYRDILKEAVIQNNRRLMNVSIYNIPLCLIHKDVWSFSRQSISPWKNIYLPICDSCGVKDNCCGIFSTSGGWQSKNIKPVS